MVVVIHSSVNRGREVEGRDRRYRAASASRRASVLGYLRTKRTSAAAWGFGFARPCSHFSSVLSLIRNLRANTAREHPSFFRVSRRSLESTFGSGATFTLILIAAQRQLAFPVALHPRHSLHQFAKNISLRHYRDPPFLAIRRLARAANSVPIEVFSAFFSLAVKSEASSLS